MDLFETDFGGRMVAIILLCIVIALCCGCSSIGETFENRVSRSLDCGQMYVNSMYGPFGITSKVSAKDNYAVPCSTPSSAAR